MTTPTSPEPSGRRIAGLRGGLALTILVALALRIAWPLADPATRFSWSNGIYTDPPTMVHAARNAVLFGQWVLDYNRDPGSTRS